jgi:hypothetical protein
VSNHSYHWRFWEVLNEVDAGSSGTHCSSLNTTNISRALECAKRYTQIYDGIVTVIHRDHPEIQFTGLALAWPDCAGSEQWFRFFLNASNHRSPVRENFATYVSEISYHWYSENGYGIKSHSLLGTWQSVAANPADVFLQSAQFLSAAKRVQQLIRELQPTRVTGANKLRVYCNEIGVLAPDPPAGSKPFRADRWWWNLEAAQYAYVYASLAALGVDAMAASQLTGYPGNAASISMLDWTNGLGNAWFWVLKMCVCDLHVSNLFHFFICLYLICVYVVCRFIDTLGSKSKDVYPTFVNGKLSNTTVRAAQPDRWTCVHSMSSAVYANTHVDPLFAQALRLHDDQKVVILVNTRNCSAQVTVDGAANSSVRVVDSHAGYEAVAYREYKMLNETLILGGERA